IRRFPQFGKRVKAEQVWRSRRYEGCMRGRGNMRHFLQQVHVLRLTAEFVITENGTEGIATETAELLFINLLEHRTLVEVHSRLEVTQEFPLGCRHHTNLDTG